ncbi:MAG: DUF6209 family protein [Kofleriaceae bacterium]
MVRLAFVFVLVGGCAVAEDLDSGASSNEAPLVGVDGSRDQADRNCHVVLRDLARNWTGFTWETEGSSWVWQGTLEMSEAAQAEGLEARVLYRNGNEPEWRLVTATPVTQPGTPGYARYTVRMSEGLPGPGMSGTAIANTHIEIVPFLALAGGGRLFDHNRNQSDLDNYVVTSPDFAIWSAPGTCTAPAGPTRAKLVFAADWSETREGVLAPGGEVTIAYDPARLTQCRNSQGGHPLYDITAHVQFDSGEHRDVSVRDAAATIAVPPTAHGVTLWFENTSTSGCQAWDSNLGDNYHFDGLVVPQWIGDVQSLIVRDSGDPCIGGGAASSGFAFDTWARQRAVVANLCFAVFQPGLTDRDDPDLWQKLDVSVHWRYAGEPDFHTQPINFDRRVGNNARYKISWRELDPFRMYHCPEVAPQPATDPQYVQLQLEYYVNVNGSEVRPAPGAAFAGTFTDYANDFWRTNNCN